MVDTVASYQISMQRILVSDKKTAPGKLLWKNCDKMKWKFTERIVDIGVDECITHTHVVLVMINLILKVNTENFIQLLPKQKSLTHPIS